MADLLDIAPSVACEVVEINGTPITVRGLSSDQIASVAGRFPHIAAVLGGNRNVGPQLIVQLGGAVGPIIAAGCGYLGDEAQERAASALPIELQFAFIKAILRVTFPNGFGSFIEELTALFKGVAEEGAKGYKVRLKTSPSPSPPSSDADSHPNLQ